MARVGFGKSAFATYGHSFRKKDSVAYTCAVEDCSKVLEEG